MSDKEPVDPVIGFRCPAEIVAELDRLAAALGVGRSPLVRRAVESLLENPSLFLPANLTESVGRSNKQSGEKVAA